MKKYFAALILAVGMAGTAAAQQATAVPPLPKWTPAPRTAASVPLGTVDFTNAPSLKNAPAINAVPLSKHGYVEEEYIISGAANVYALEGVTADFLKSFGFGAGRTVAKANVPYTTRILVRRPTDVGDFSGTVQLEPIRDITEGTSTWQRTWPYIVANGDIWVGVTVSKANVAKMHKAFDAKRYVSLDISDEGQRWDMLAQVAGLMRSKEGPLEVLGFLDIAAVKPGLLRVYSSGWSLTGCMQIEFINKGHHAHWRRADGKPIIDGYLAGICPFGGAIAVPADAAVIQVMSESEYRGAPDLPADMVKAVVAARQPDASKVGEKRFRWYDVAGSAHADYADQLQFGISGYQTGGVGENKCAKAITRLPGVDNIARGAVRSLDDWVRSGRYAPPGKLFELNPDGTIKRDARGNALGGVRPHWIEVPTATFVPITAPHPDTKPDPITNTVDGFCALLGHEVPFAPDVIAKLYKDRAEYVDKVTDVVVALVNGKYMLPADGDAELATARAAK